MERSLDHRALYRLPWSLADNPIAWLEPTQACNLACDGCYRKNVREHKPLAEVERDLEVFAALRNFDGVSIAGGDPLTHPRVVDIVRSVTRMGRKAILNTNGLALTRDLLVDLKKAGLVGLTFHVDSKQGRPGWRDKTEGEMNALRSEFAELVESVGGLACAFNATVYEDTLAQVPDVVEWAARNIARVHTVVFIVYRAAQHGRFDYYARGRKVDMGRIVYSSEAARRIDLSARDVVRTVRARFPDFEPCAYLNGTEDPTSFKWLVSLRIGDGRRIHGYAGPKFMEATQALHHLVSGRYMSYAPASTLRLGRALMATSLWDPGVRAAAGRYLRGLARRPRSLFETQHLQAVVMIQPIDLLPDGRQSMCDGCPDMTVHEGRLAWSCRLEELRAFGEFVVAVPKDAPAVARPEAGERRAPGPTESEGIAEA